MTAWQDAGAGARLRGGETHPKVLLADGGKPDGQRTGLIVPRESNLPGAVKYRMLSRARRRAQETARRVLVAVATWAVLAASPAPLAAPTVEGEFERTLAVGSDPLTLDVRTGSGPVPGAGGFVSRARRAALGTSARGRVASGSTCPRMRRSRSMPGRAPATSAPNTRSSPATRRAGGGFRAPSGAAAPW